MSTCGPVFQGIRAMPLTISYTRFETGGTKDDMVIVEAMEATETYESVPECMTPKVQAPQLFAVADFIPSPIHLSRVLLACQNRKYDCGDLEIRIRMRP